MGARARTDFDSYITRPDSAFRDDDPDEEEPMKDRVTRIAAAIGIVLVALALAFAIVVGALAFFAGKPYEACWVPTYNGIPTTVVDGQPVVICQTVWRVSFD